jgi:Flp pilus assembly protein TadG
MKVNGKTRTSRAVGRWSRVGNDPGILLSPSGQSLLEVALLTPMLLALLLGGIELGRYAYFSILVGNAARAGAAYGAQNLVLSVDTAGIQTAAKNDFQNNGQNTSKLTVISSNSCGCDSTGAVSPASSCSTATNPGAGICTSGGHWVVMVSVTASGTINSLFNYPGIPKSPTVSSTATLRVAQK